MRSLGLALPQFGKGKFAIQQNIILTFGTAPNTESYSLDFIWVWERCKRIKQLTDALGQEAEELKINLQVGVEFENGLEFSGQDFLNIRDILPTLEIGKITLDAVPLKEPAE